MESFRHLALGCCVLSALAGMLRLFWPDNGFKSVINAVLVLYILTAGIQMLGGIDWDSIVLTLRSLPAGQSLAIIGPSAAGKSTLCKLLLSIWAPTAGKVRIDRADIHSWDSEKLGPYIGYLPQDVELFAGSVAENIARMGDVDSQKVIAAAQMAGVHSTGFRISKGYDTQIGEHGAALSGGQRQRIGLARALYGDPRLVVLDEPNSNLDEEGEQQLARAVLNLKQRNATVVLVTHKPSILNIVDNIIVMQEGQIALSGPRQAVLEKLAAMRHQQEQAAQARVQQEKIARQQQALQKQQEALQKTQEAGGNA